MFNQKVKSIEELLLKSNSYLITDEKSAGKYIANYYKKKYEIELKVVDKFETTKRIYYVYEFIQK